MAKSVGNKEAEDVDGLFLGEMTSGEEPWMAGIAISNSKVPFNIDTGAGDPTSPY